VSAVSIFFLISAFTLFNNCFFDSLFTFFYISIFLKGIKINNNLIFPNVNFSGKLIFRAVWWQLVADEHKSAADELSAASINRETDFSYNDYYLQVISYVIRYIFTRRYWMVTGVLMYLAGN
jgi:hypothetical protein